MRKGLPEVRALVTVGVTSARLLTLAPSMPWAAASLTKSGERMRRGGVVLVVEGLLPLADHAEEAVVDDGDVDGELLLHDGGELGGGHLEAAVAGDDPDVFLGAGELRADGCGEREAHGAEAAGGDERARGFVLEVLGLPHLVLAYVGDDDGLFEAAGGVASRQMSLMTCAA